jgi:hypothetical protein
MFTGPDEAKIGMTKKLNGKNLKASFTIMTYI